MTYWYSGSITARDCPSVPDELIALFKARRMVPDGDTIGVYSYSPQCIEFCDYMAGDLSGDLEQICREAANLGLHLDGWLSFVGDYDGGYEIEDNVLTDYDNAGWVIRNADIWALTEELQRRGYSVKEAP